MKKSIFNLILSLTLLLAIFVPAGASANANIPSKTLEDRSWVDLYRDILTSKKAYNHVNRWEDGGWVKKPLYVKDKNYFGPNKFSIISHKDFAYPLL